MTREEQILQDNSIPKSYVDQNRKWVHEAFMDGVDWADEHPKSPWISVNDRLPEIYKTVFLYNKNKIPSFYFGFLKPEEYRSNGMWSIIWGDSARDNEITHWMLMPELEEE